MNRLLFVLAWLVLALVLYPAFYGSVSPKGGDGAGSQRLGCLVAPCHIGGEFRTNVCLSFPVPYDLTLTLQGLDGLPNEGSLSVSVYDPKDLSLCLERTLDLASGAPDTALMGSASKGLVFTFVLDKEADLAGIDPVKGPFFVGPGQKGVMPGTVYDWEIRVKAENFSGRGLLWLTALKQWPRVPLFYNYLRLLALGYALGLSLLLMALLWFWHAGSHYRLVREGLGALVLGLFLWAGSACGQVSLASGENEISQELPLLCKAGEGTLYSLTNGLVFVGNSSLVVLDGQNLHDSLPLGGKCVLGLGFMQSHARGEFYGAGALRPVSALAEAGLCERSLAELKRKLGPPSLEGTGACLFVQWNFSDGSSLLVSHEGGRCKRLERQIIQPGGFLALRQYGGRVPAWAGISWRYFHLCGLVLIMLLALSLVVRAMLYGRSAAKLLRLAAFDKKEEAKS